MPHDLLDASCRLGWWVRWRGPDDYPYDLPQLRTTLSPKGFFQ
ncbi:hypothetical protein SEA_GETALONG_68 [Gordonia phage Getalong]|uniref:Uncharacterized protein n=1 Tax=Gordonia phage Getalong TaxID=2315531 RepID=A0A386KEC4_9CAUD|nr:hypothetical protein HOU38_gp068 [Gordonia phage Getalong]AYD83928.1 hypothetical protein SEA_GETALONG_68 [Gordonia phage Getalong]